MAPHGAIVFLVVLALVAIWWSAPPYVPLGPFRIENDRILSAHTLWFPSGLLYVAIPGLRFLRVYARFGLLASLAISALAGIGWVAAMRSRAIRWHRGLLAGVLVVVAAVEFSVVAPCWDVQTPPPVYAWLAAQPSGTIVEYPFCRSTDAIHAEYLFWQRVHRHPMVNGAAGGVSINPWHQPLSDLTAPGVPSMLRTLNVRYVVVHRDRYDEVARSLTRLHLFGSEYELSRRHQAPQLPPPSRDIPGLKAVATFGETTVYTLEG